MAGTKAGGAKARETNVRKYGADYYRRIGAEGGKKKSPLKGFGSHPEKASEYGKIGGSRSKPRRK